MVVKTAGSRVWPALPILAIFLVSPTSARGERIDIDDPDLLGPVRFWAELGSSPYQHLRTQVRYGDGLYSYVYAVQSNPYFPGTSCCRAGLLSFAVTGHPLEETWGAINSSDAFWPKDDEAQTPLPTRLLKSITPIHDGFIVVADRVPGRYAVMYMQSPLPPSPHGLLTYTGWVRDWDQEGVLRVESFQRDGALVPTPEPGSLVLFGLGLASLAAKRRAMSRRLRR